jgi:putative flippase GtrA
LYNFGELVRYGLVGVANNFVGLLVIYAALKLGLSPIVANIIGYSVGLITSYLGNKKFTFANSKKSSGKKGFIISFGIAYSLNLIVLIACAKLGEIHKLIPQIFAVVAYSFSFFILMKFWIFKAEK